ncbi:MAG: hypothetical protein ACXWXO_19570 [Nocardioides sp.]
MTTQTLTWNASLIDQLDFHWQRLLRPRFEGLTDAEYLWEPVPESWTVRPRLGEEGLVRPCGAAEGPYGDLPLAALVLHINREAIHHGADIALLRDLYAHR